MHLRDDYLNLRKANRDCSAIALACTLVWVLPSSRTLIPLDLEMNWNSSVSLCVLSGYDFALRADPIETETIKVLKTFI